MESFTKLYFLCIWQEELSSNTDLVQSHRERISKASNLVNIELLWKTYNRYAYHTHHHTSHKRAAHPTTTHVIFSFLSPSVAETWTSSATTPSSKYPPNFSSSCLLVFFIWISKSWPFLSFWPQVSSDVGGGRSGPVWGRRCKSKMFLFLISGSLRHILSCFVITN